ncbi:hypothetical protein QR685DRAFT_422493, partial [Neurospora intermedia]
PEPDRNNRRLWQTYGVDQTVAKHAPRTTHEKPHIRDGLNQTQQLPKFHFDL